MKTAFVKDNIRYTFSVSDTEKTGFIYLAVSDVKLTWERVYKVKVIDNWKYAYKINKKSLSSVNGEYGLFRFLKCCIDTDLNMISVMHIIGSITNNMRQTEVYAA